MRKTKVVFLIDRFNLDYSPPVYPEGHIFSCSSEAEKYAKELTLKDEDGSGTRYTSERYIYHYTSEEPNLSSIHRVYQVSSPHQYYTLHSMSHTSLLFLCESEDMVNEILSVICDAKNSDNLYRTGHDYKYILSNCDDSPHFKYYIISDSGKGAKVWGYYSTKYDIKWTKSKDNKSKIGYMENNGK